MKSRLIIAAMALIVATATQALAQGGIVAWVGVAGTCAVGTGSAARKINLGTVSFAGTASGRINLTCPLDVFMRVDPTAVNAWGLIFKNDNGFVGGIDKCTVSAQFIQQPHTNPTLPILLSSFSTTGHSYSGFNTIDPISTGAVLDVDHNTYAVTLTLQRVSGATCNPQVWVAFAEDIIP